MEAGRNNLWPLLTAIVILFIVGGLFYLGRFFYRKRKGEGEANEGLNNKVSQRLNSLDAFRGYLQVNKKILFNLFLLLHRLTILLMIFVNWGAGLFYQFPKHNRC